MAFADYLNPNRLQAAINNPWTQIGMQLLAAGGPQAQQMSGGQRFAQAVQGFQAQQAQQQELQMQQALRQIQMGQLQRQERKDTREEQSVEQIRNMINNDPNMLSQYPIARAVAGMTGDLSKVGELIKATQPSTVGQPKTPWQYKTTDAQGFVTEHTYDPATGRFVQGTPYRPTAQQAVDLRGAQFATGVDQFERQQSLRERQAEIGNANQAQQLDLKRQQIEQTQAANSQKNYQTALKNNIARSTLESGYRNAAAQLDDRLQLVRETLNHPGLGGNFGPRGIAPNVPGSDAADAAAKIERLKAGLGLTGLVELEKQGIKLTPVSNTDLATAERSMANLDKSQSAESARNELKRIEAILLRAKEEAGLSFNNLSSMYQQAPAQGGQGNYASPQTQEDFDALPAGSLYIDPDDGRLYRK